MTDTIDHVAAEPDVEAGPEQVSAAPAIDEQGVAEQLVAKAREKGIELSARTGCSAVSPSGCWRPR